MRRITMILAGLAIAFFIADFCLSEMGDVTNEFPVPDEISHVFDNGIAWDGDNLWVPCRSPADGYYLGARQIDPETGQLTGEALPNTTYSVAGVAFDQSTRILWHLAYPCGPIYGVNVDTNSTVTFFSPGVCWLHDITFDGEYLWVTKDNGTVYQFNPDTGQRVGFFIGPGGITDPYGIGPNLSGVTYDSRYFWFTRGVGGGSNNQRFYKVDPEIALPDGHSDNAIVDCFDLPFGSMLASDGSYLWTSYYNQDNETKMIAKIDTATTVSPTNERPHKPILSLPADGDTNIICAPKLETGDFSDPDSGDTHAQTQWQISEQSDFSSFILDKTSAVHLTRLTVPKCVLDKGTTYYWRVRFYDNHYAQSEWSDTYSFTTWTPPGDQNSNGIPDTQEIDDTVDLDNDGTSDVDQNDMKCVSTIVGGGEIGISRKASASVDSIESMESVDSDTICDTVHKPHNMPLGIVAFKLKTKNPGDIADITLYFSRAAPPEAKWYWHNSVDGWLEYSAHAQFSVDRKSVTLELKDGGCGDADGVANGIIVDPSGFGLSSSSVASGSSGACFIGILASELPIKRETN